MHPGVAPALQNYSAQGIDFDGTDRLARGAALTGVADGQLMSMSFWAKIAPGTGVNQQALRMVSAVGGATQRIRIDKPVATENLRIFIRNAANADLLSIETTAALCTGVWRHALFSVNLAATAASKMVYLDDVLATLTVTTQVNGTGNFSAPDTGIAGPPDGVGAQNIIGELADMMVWFDQAIDFSVEANRRKFIFAGNPVNPQVAISTFGPPAIALYGPVAAWQTNKGSGGGFTLIGTLTKGTNP